MAICCSFIHSGGSVGNSPGASGSVCSLTPCRSFRNVPCKRNKAVGFRGFPINFAPTDNTIVFPPAGQRPHLLDIPDQGRTASPVPPRFECACDPVMQHGIGAAPQLLQIGRIERGRLMALFRLMRHAVGPCRGT